MNIRPRWVVATLLACAVAACALAGVETQPVMGSGAYRIGDGEETAFEGPFSAVTDENTVVTVSFAMRVPPLHAGKYVVSADDCLESLSVNGRDIDGPLPFCDYAKGVTLDLRGTLRAGDNDVRATIKNNGGPTSLRFSVAPADPLHASIAVAVVLLLVAALFASGIPKKLGFTPAMEATLAVALGARCMYAAYTSYTERAYDVDGHIEYVRHVLQHWGVPQIADGWQFYQPPLYYLATGGVVRLAQALGVAESSAVSVMQLASFGLSAGSLLLAGWIASSVFRTKGKADEKNLAFALYAFFPAVVFFSARVNNDVLLELLGLAAIGCLWRWWESGRASWWHACAFAASFAVLTKTNAALLLPVAAACLALRPKTPAKTKVFLAASACAVLFAVNGWYVALRLMEGQSRLVPNIANLNSALRVSTDPVTMFEFNPARLVAQPYNNPWSDADGRQHFWEYLYRSAFTGEFSFGARLAPLASAAIALSLAMAVAALAGIRGSWKESPLRHMPIWLSPIILLAGHAAYREFSAPYSSSQDYRYSILATLPIAILAVMGLHRLPRKFARAGRVVAWSFAASCAIFVVSIGNA